MSFFKIPKRKVFNIYLTNWCGGIIGEFVGTEFIRCINGRCGTKWCVFNVKGVLLNSTTYEAFFDDTNESIKWTVEQNTQRIIKLSFDAMIQWSLFCSIEVYSRTREEKAQGRNLALKNGLSEVLRVIQSVLIRWTLVNIYLHVFLRMLAPVRTEMGFRTVSLSLANPKSSTRSQFVRDSSETMILFASRWGYNDISLGSVNIGNVRARFFLRATPVSPSKSRITFAEYQYDAYSGS